MATEMIKGKTPQEALTMSGEDLSAPLGPLPPMKIHCAQLVEGALKNALTGEPAPAPGANAPRLADSLQPKGAVKINFR
jgi:NifU-like protein involved in Fe-S cluster formation